MTRAEIPGKITPMNGADPSQSAHVEVWLTATCPFCHAARRLLDDLGIDYVVHDLSHERNRRAVTEAILPGHRTVPLIVIDGEPIGGYNELEALARSGDLEAKVIKVSGKTMSDETNEVHETLILGSGPAGWTAAIYAARANMKPLLLKGMQPGGQLTITTDVENYPGFPDGVMGPEMMEMFEKQATRFGTIVKAETGTSVDLSKRPFKVETNLDKVYLAQTLIISTGASANYLGLENETKLQGRGVSACATCDGFFFQDKDVCVVGGGDSACEEATFLTKYASKVRMLVRRDEFRASKIMQDRALNNPKIEVVWNTQVVDVMDPEEGKVTGLVLENTKTGDSWETPTEGLFLAIGHTPNTQLFKGQLDMDESGYLITTPDATSTKVPGVFACGDCQDKIWRQAITAAGTGCMSALEAERFLEAHGHA